MFLLLPTECEVVRIVDLGENFEDLQIPEEIKNKKVEITDPGYCRESITDKNKKCKDLFLKVLGKLYSCNRNLISNNSGEEFLAHALEIFKESQKVEEKAKYVEGPALFGPRRKL